MFHSSEDRKSTATHKKDRPSEHYAAGGQTQKGRVLLEGSDWELTHRPHNTICSMGRWGGHPGCLASHPVSWACRQRRSAPSRGQHSASVGRGWTAGGAWRDLACLWNCRPPSRSTRWPTFNHTPCGCSDTRRGRVLQPPSPGLSSQSLGSCRERLGLFFNRINLTGFISRALK